MSSGVKIEGVYRLRKPIQVKLTLGESIKKLKELANGIDEYHIVNPSSQVVFKLTDIVRLLKIIEVPKLIGESKD
tara:strand:- start:1206 stop:1430 length:225 start_codon:yes stop_codon:yes gene_type:complete